LKLYAKQETIHGGPMSAIKSNQMC